MHKSQAFWDQVQSAETPEAKSIREQMEKLGVESGEKTAAKTIVTEYRCVPPPEFSAQSKAVGLMDKIMSRCCRFQRTRELAPEEGLYLRNSFARPTGSVRSMTESPAFMRRSLHET